MAATPLRAHDFTNWKQKSTYRPSLRMSLMLSAGSSTLSVPTPLAAHDGAAARQAIDPMVVVDEDAPAAASALTSPSTQSTLHERVRQLEAELSAARQQLQEEQQSQRAAEEQSESDASGAASVGVHARAVEGEHAQGGKESARKEQSEKQAHPAAASPSDTTPSAAAAAAAAVAAPLATDDEVDGHGSHEVATQTTEPLPPVALGNAHASPHTSSPPAPALAALSTPPPLQDPPALRDHAPSPSSLSAPPPPQQSQSQPQAQVLRPLQLPRSPVPRLTVEQLQHDVHRCACEIERLVEDQHELRCSMHEMLTEVSMLVSFHAEAPQRSMQEPADRSRHASMHAPSTHLSVTPTPSKSTTPAPSSSETADTHGKHHHTKTAERRGGAAGEGQSGGGSNATDAAPPAWLVPWLNLLRAEQAEQLQHMREEMLVMLCHTVVDVRRASSASPPPVRETAARALREAHRAASCDSRSSDSGSFLRGCALAAPLRQEEQQLQPHAYAAVLESETRASEPPPALLLQRYRRLLSPTPPDARSVQSGVMSSSASAGGASSLKRHDALWTALLAMQEAVQAQSAQLTRMEERVASSCASSPSSPRAAAAPRHIEAPLTRPDAAASGVAADHASASTHQQPHQHRHTDVKPLTAHAATAAAEAAVASPPPRPSRERSRLRSPPRHAAAAAAAVDSCVASSVKKARAHTSVASTRSSSSSATEFSTAAARQHRHKHHRQLDTIQSEMADLRLLLRETLVQNHAQPPAPQPTQVQHRPADSSRAAVLTPPPPLPHRIQPAVVASPTSRDVSHLRAVSDYPSSFATPVAGGRWAQNEASGPAHCGEAGHGTASTAAAAAAAPPRQRARTTLTSSLVYPPA